MDALDMLRLQLEWGADEALDEAPVDRLRPAPVPIASPSLSRSPLSGTSPSGTPASASQASATSNRPAPSGTPVERAIRAAAQADTLDALKAVIASFEGDPLRDMATNMVFAAGDPDTGLMLIGGAPGADEDRSGMPFSGREGALLDQMLASVGLQRQAMVVAHVIPWRPPGGRVPSPGELQLYRPFLGRLITLAAPSRLVMFGTLAASTVLGVAQRGRSIAWLERPVEGQTMPVLVLPALGDLLKTPSRRKDAWAGLRLLRRALDEADRT